MACVDLTYISNEECIGNSLSSINGNFAALSAAVCDLSASSPFNVFDSPTIELDWNSSTRTLSADVKPDSIRYSHLASWQTLSGSPTLSAEAVQPRLAKAWVTFNGTVATPVLSSAFNISSITKESQGRYTINFITPMTNFRYLFFGLSRYTSDSFSGANCPCITAMLSDSKTLSSFKIVTCTSTLLPTDYPETNVVVFGN